MKFADILSKLYTQRTGQHSGQFQSVLRGAGIEISDARKYVVGDAKKSVNRKLTAKYNDVHVSLFEQEKGIYIDLFCDINYNRSSAQIYTNIQNILIDMIAVASKEGICVQLYYYDKKMCSEQISKNNYATIQTVMLELIKSRIPQYQSNISLFLDAMVRKKKNRMIMIIGDFLQLTDHDANRMLLLQKEQQLLLCRFALNPYEGYNYIGIQQPKKTPLDAFYINI